MTTHSTLDLYSRQNVILTIFCLTYFENQSKFVRVITKLSCFEIRRMIELARSASLLVNSDYNHCGAADNFISWLSFCVIMNPKSSTDLINPRTQRLAYYFVQEYENRSAVVVHHTAASREESAIGPVSTSHWTCNGPAVLNTCSTTSTTKPSNSTWLVLLMFSEMIDKSSWLVDRRMKNGLLCTVNMSTWTQQRCNITTCMISCAANVLGNDAQQPMLRHCAKTTKRIVEIHEAIERVLKVHLC